MGPHRFRLLSIKAARRSTEKRNPTWLSRKTIPKRSWIAQGTTYKPKIIPSSLGTSWADAQKSTTGKHKPQHPSSPPHTQTPSSNKKCRKRLKHSKQDAAREKPHWYHLSGGPCLAKIIGWILTYPASRNGFNREKQKVRTLQSPFPWHLQLWGGESRLWMIQTSAG